MRLEIDIAEHHYNNIMALDSVSLGRVPYKGIIMYSINAIKHGKVLDQEPRKDEVILTNKEYRELISNEYENGYCKGYTEALGEQEPILDKIRAEIIAKDKNVKAVRSDSCYFFTAEEVFEIIDKYKGESEE